MTEPSARGPWLRSPAHDLAMAFAWFPFALGAHLLANDPERFRWLVSATLLFSFAHQPLTLWLVYGDRAQRRAHRALFTWAPMVTVVTIAAGSSLHPEVVALAAGAWNLVHTLRQRYGVSRLYGRLCGTDCSDDHRLLWSWLALAVLIALLRADLGDTAHRAGLGARNIDAIEVLDWIRPIALLVLPVAVAVALGFTSRSVRDELRRRHASPGRLTYLGSTGMLLVVLALEPAAGFVGYVGAHAAEYLFVVSQRIDRNAERPTAGDRVGALARRLGSVGTLAVYAVVVVAFMSTMRAAQGTDLVLVTTLTLGALHILYDGVIWRSPQPARDAQVAELVTSDQAP